MQARNWEIAFNQNCCLSTHHKLYFGILCNIFFWALYKKLKSLLSAPQIARYLFRLRQHIISSAHVALIAKCFLLLEEQTKGPFKERILFCDLLQSNVNQSYVMSASVTCLGLLWTFIWLLRPLFEVLTTTNLTYQVFLSFCTPPHNSPSWLMSIGLLLQLLIWNWIFLPNLAKRAPLPFTS